MGTEQVRALFSDNSEQCALDLESGSEPSDSQRAPPTDACSAETDSQNHVLNSLSASELRAAAKEGVLRAIQHVEEVLDLELIVPEITFNLRGRAAGQFRYLKPRSAALSRLHRQSQPQQQALRFNLEVLERYTSSFFEEVIPHEISHFAAYNVYGLHIRPHGKEWRHLMEHVFQVPARVTHEFDLGPARTTQTYHYQCACVGEAGSHQLSAVRHKRIQKKSSEYRCKKCLQILTLSE